MDELKNGWVDDKGWVDDGWKNVDTPYRTVDMTVAWTILRVAAYEMLYPAHIAVKWERSGPQLSKPGSIQVSLSQSARQSAHITTRHSATFLSCFWRSI